MFLFLLATLPIDVPNTELECPPAWVFRYQKTSVWLNDEESEYIKTCGPEMWKLIESEAKSKHLMNSEECMDTSDYTNVIAFINVVRHRSRGIPEPK